MRTHYMYYIILQQSRRSPLVWWSKAMHIIRGIQHIYEYHARASESRMKNNCFSRLTLWVPTLQHFLFKYCVPNPRGTWRKYIKLHLPVLDEDRRRTCPAT